MKIKTARGKDEPTVAYKVLHGLFYYLESLPIQSDCLKQGWN